MLNKKDLKDIYNFSERELLKIIKTSGDKIKKYSNKNPNEVKKTIMGGGLGAGLATLLGYTGSIGIVGYGRLGKIISEYAEAFRMNVFFVDPNVETPSNIKVKKTSLINLLKISDYIVISASYLPGDPPILAEEEFKYIKKEARRPRFLTSRAPTL